MGHRPDSAKPGSNSEPSCRSAHPGHPHVQAGCPRWPRGSASPPLARRIADPPTASADRAWSPRSRPVADGPPLVHCAATSLSITRRKRQAILAAIGFVIGVGAHVHPVDDAIDRDPSGTGGNHPPGQYGRVPFGALPPNPRGNRLRNLGPSVFGRRAGHLAQPTRRPTQSCRPGPGRQTSATFSARSRYSVRARRHPRCPSAQSDPIHWLQAAHAPGGSAIGRRCREPPWPWPWRQRQIIAQADGKAGAPRQPDEQRKSGQDHAQPDQ